ncbi:solute carrier family 35 member f2 [Plakobranchus ocellatus]|uniref:Solute carrier family 35 member f2 n=1 Tax=Plakobranchus ocellatus TaxID=259542 RepID=A0AAV4C756_9GAST|nr:solute carrier family 35 member f2 [Plakobranchus ocellatus]
MSTYESLGPTSDESDTGSDDYVLLGQRHKKAGESKLSAGVRLLCTTSIVRPLLLGQFLSILLCGTGVFSGLLQNQHVNLPTSQSFLMYALLCLTFSTRLAYHQGERNLFRILISLDGLKYALIGLIDVEANFLVVKAYAYTSVTSVQILDCFSIAVVLLLSRLLLKTQYQRVHYGGVLISLAGLSGLIVADVITGRNGDGTGSNPALGDLFVVLGAIMYGISNVAQEFVVKNYNTSEFLGMLGVFSTLFSGIQIIVLEGDDLSHVNFNYKVVLLWLGYVLFLYLIYTCMAYVIQQTSATVTNLSILSADFYSLILGIFIFNYAFHALYLVAFAVVMLGIAVYTCRPTETTSSPPSVNSPTQIPEKE